MKLTKLLRFNFFFLFVVFMIGPPILYARPENDMHPVIQLDHNFSVLNSQRSSGHIIKKKRQDSMKSRAKSGTLLLAQNDEDETDISDNGSVGDDTIPEMDNSIFEDGNEEVMPQDEDMDSIFSDPSNKIDSEDEIEPIDVVKTDDEKFEFSINGEIEQKTAYRLKKSHHFSMIKNTLNLQTSGRISEDAKFSIGVEAYYDAVFDVTNEYNEDVKNDQEKEAFLKDAFMDLSLGRFDLRLGNQQIVWGQAVGLFFADIVNPKDLREFILPDLDQIRTHVVAANLEYFGDDNYLQIIYIPFPDFNKFGKPGSEFDYSASLFAQNADIVFNDPVEPSNDFKNGEAGTRFGKMIGNWDVSLFYLYDMYDFPVNYRTITANPGSSLHPITITYTPRYERMHRAGSTFSTEIEGAVLKGEFIYSDKMFLQTSDTSDIDGYIKSETLDWLLGVDYTFFKKLETNFQLMQRVILDYQETMVDKEVKTSLSAWAKTGMLDNKVEFELFAIFGINQTDIMFRPKIFYHFNEKTDLIIGADLFYGESDGDFGLFDNNDRICFEFRYKL